MDSLHAIQVAQTSLDLTRKMHFDNVSKASQDLRRAIEIREAQEKELQKILDKNLLLTRIDSIRLYPDRVVRRKQVINISEIIEARVTMTGTIEQIVSEDPNSWKTSIYTRDKRVMHVVISSHDKKITLEAKPIYEPEARKFVEMVHDVMENPGQYRAWEESRKAELRPYWERLDAARAAEAAAQETLAAAQADTGAVAAAEAELARLTAQASPAEREALAKAEKGKGRRRALLVALGVVGGAVVTVALSAAASAMLLSYLGYESMGALLQDVVADAMESAAEAFKAAGTSL